MAIVVAVAGLSTNFATTDTATLSTALTISLIALIVAVETGWCRRKRSHEEAEAEAQEGLQRLLCRTASH
jgi:hypothetical protein